ncbi:retrovirus-related pol polyprotein from transposon opus [Plakobranchus ocellatus]|uniref:Retrovirus-related pol polyprotein from transposon opus n=1 Tax=Plakobranchus ocellatus TaxID=259542 RepID=A0AAV3Y950_9GAST|nr:retrovirus-related pol polyprotein from transposon opus [Plakobranchus ocellatus]
MWEKDTSTGEIVQKVKEGCVGQLEDEIVSDWEFICFGAHKSQKNLEQFIPKDEREQRSEHAADRLCNGLLIASEIFQHQVANLIQGIQAKNYSDDIIVYGKSETGNRQEARKNHDENLSNLLQRLKQNNVTANAAKCSFHKTKLKFHGYIFSQDGISTDPEKLQALKDATPP